MRLSRKQGIFAQMVSILIQEINRRGFYCTYSCTRCVKPGHHKKGSLHYIGLAVDLNLFSGDGEYIKNSDDPRYLQFGEFWEVMGGSWGGRFSDGDANHFSLEHNGRR